MNRGVEIGIVLGGGAELGIDAHGDLFVGDYALKDRRRINLGKATPQRVDFILSCFEQLTIHTAKENAK